MKNMIELINLDTQEVFILNKSKMLLGSSESIDISLQDETIAAYHALFVIENGGWVVKDLDSRNGILINSLKVSKHVLDIDDIIQVGHIKLSVSKSTSKDFLNIDELAIEEEKVVVIRGNKTKKGSVLIDDEWCDLDIKTCESALKELNQLNSLNLTTLASTENDLESLDTPFDINSENKECFFKIETYLMGSLDQVNYLPLTQNKLIASPFEESGILYCPDLEEQACLIENDNGVLKLNLPEQYSIFEDERSSLLQTNISFGNKNVFYKITYSGEINKLRDIPFYQRDLGKFKKDLIQSSLMILPFLMLTFVSFENVEEKTKKVASVIYKQVKVVGDNLKSTKVKSMTVSNKKNKVKSVKKNVVKSEKNIAKKPSKDIGVDDYAKMFDDFNVSDIKVARKPASANINDNDSSITINNNSAGIGKFKSSSFSGTEVAGNGKFGLKGIKGKENIDFDIEETKTIVKGSIDPELLRRIMSEYLPQFRHCYQKELVSNDNVKGIINLNFRISGGGDLSKINVLSRNGYFSKPGLDCMAKVLSIIEFPNPKGGGVVDIKQPLNFFVEKG